MEKLLLNYFYGNEADSFTFYRIPKILFTNAKFKGLSCEAKVLYGLLLDRVSLSIEKKWFDEENRAYIIFPIKEIMEMMGCSNPKAVKTLAELDSDKGIGLIEKKRLGLGKASIIYVKKIMIQDSGNESPEGDMEEGNKALSAESSRDSENKDASGAVMEEKYPEIPASSQKLKKLTSRSKEDLFQEISGITGEEKGDFQKLKILTSGNKEILLPEVNKKDGVESVDFQKSKILTSGNQKTLFQEVKKIDCNYTEYSNTDYSNTESNQSTLSILSTKPRSYYVSLLKRNINYDIFCQDETYRSSEDIVENIINLMADIMSMDTDTVYVANKRRSIREVREQFLKINYITMQYILRCLQQSSTKKENIRQYILTTVFNAPDTINLYYQAQVNYDTAHAET